MDNIIQKINEAVKSIRFGEVIIKIQDNRIIQIEKLEKIRVGTDSEKGEVKK